MPSTASTTFEDMIEGKLLAAIATGTTAGVTVKIKQFNGATPTWPTAAHRLKIVQKTATNNKVEKVDVAAGTTQSGQTVTLGTLTRALPLDNGTDFTGSGTAQTFAAGADVFLAWDSHDAAQTAKKDLANTFTTHQTISSTNELRFADSATAVWDDGTSLSFKDSTTATKTLAQLAALSGSDEKLKVSIDDTNARYLAEKLTGGDGISVTVINDAGDEDLDIDIDLATDPGLEFSAGQLRAKIDSTGLTRTSSGLGLPTPGADGQVLTSNGTVWASEALPGTLRPFLSPIADSASFGALGAETDAPAGFLKTFLDGDLAAGDVVHFEFCAHYTQGTTPKNVVAKLKLGSTALVTFATQTGASGSFWARGKFIVRTIAGSLEHNIEFDSTNPKAMTAVTEAVNTTVVFKPTVTFAADTTSPSAIVDYFHVYKISAPA